MFALKSRRPARGVRVACTSSTPLQLEVLEARDCPAEIFWTNGAKDGLWSTKGNWSGGVLPTASDTIIFDSKSSDASSQQDILNNVTVAAIRIQNNYAGDLIIPTLLTVTNLTIDSDAKFSGDG